MAKYEDRAPRIALWRNEDNSLSGNGFEIRKSTDGKSDHMVFLKPAREGAELMVGRLWRADGDKGGMVASGSMMKFSEKSDGWRLSLFKNERANGPDFDLKVTDGWVPQAPAGGDDPSQFDDDPFA